MARKARHACVIVNPRAGRGQAAAILSDLTTALRGNGLVVSICPTEWPGHARLLAAEAVNLASHTVICVGGDGTLNEVVNGVLGVGEWPDGLTLAVMPMGTANSFVRDFGLRSGQWREAMRRLFEGRWRRVDAGIATTDAGFSRYFVNNLGIGFMADIAQAAKRWCRLLGATGYSAAVVGELARLSAPMTHVALSGPDGESSKDLPLSMIAICSTQWTGDQMHIAPQADASDGLLDVLTVGNLSRLDVVRAFPTVFTGRHLSHPLVSSDRARHVQVVPSVARRVVVDGEVLTRTPVTVQVVPAAIRVAL